MTYAQWVWEFYAYAEDDERRKKELREIIKISQRLFMESLISVLGCRFQKSNEKALSEAEEKKAKEAIDPQDVIPPFVPFSLLVAPADRIQDAQRSALVEDKVKEATKEGSSFDKMSEAIASGDMDGDLAPFIGMIEGRLSKEDYMNREGGIQDHLDHSESPEDDIREMMRSLGIEERPEDAPEAPHVSAKPKKMAEIDLFPEDWWAKNKE